MQAVRWQGAGSVPERLRAATLKGCSAAITEGKGGDGRGECKRRGGGSPRCTGARSKQELVAPVLVQRQVHHFGRRHPGGLRGNSSPELCLVCAVQLLHRRVLPGGQALYHAAARMGTPAGGKKWSKGQGRVSEKDPKSEAGCKTVCSTVAELCECC